MSEVNLPSVYIAGPWSEKEHLKTVRDLFVEAGFHCTSRWLNIHIGGNNGMSESPEILKEEALNDIEDVVNADILVLYNCQPRGQETTGKAVEFGIALMSGKGIIVVGNKSNVFHFLGMPNVENMTEALELCKNFPWLPNQKPEHLLTDEEKKAELDAMMKQLTEAAFKREAEKPLVTISES